MIILLLIFRLLVTITVVLLHLNIDRNLADMHPFHLTAWHIHAVEKLLSLVATPFPLLLGCSVVERHIELGINLVDYTADNRAIGSHSYYKISLVRSL